MAESKSIKVESNETPIGKFLTLKRNITFCQSFVGVGILSSTYKPSVLTFFTLSVIICYMISSLWTLTYFWNDIFEQIETFCIYGVYCPGAYKFFDVYRSRKIYNELYLDTESIYAKNSQDGSRRSNILLQCISESTKQSYSIIIFLAFAAMTFGIYPFYRMILQPGYFLYFNTHIPLVDPYTFWGNIITNAYLLSCGVNGVIGSIGYDLMYQTLICSYTARIRLLNDSLEQLSSMWELGKSTKFSRFSFFRNIIIQMNETDRYIETLNGAIIKGLTIQIFWSSLTIALSLFAVVATEWKSGYGFSLFMLTQLLLLSYMGTIVDNTKDELIRAVYNCKWYLLPLKEQKMLLILLIKAQNSKQIAIGGFYPVNVETGLAIIKSIYQLLMMLLKSLE